MLASLLEAAPFYADLSLATCIAEIGDLLAKTIFPTPLSLRAIAIPRALGRRTGARGREEKDRRKGEQEEGSIRSPWGLWPREFRLFHVGL